MQQKLNLNADTILEKKFNVDFKGYNGEEVDSFLDLIVQDYDSFNEVITELGKILVDYEEKNELLQKENESLKLQLAKQSIPNVTSNNQLELLTRIARLEEAVFKNK